MRSFLIATLFAATQAAAVRVGDVAPDVTPWQMHLAFAGADGVRAAWKTDAPAPSVCKYGVSGGPLTQTATGASPVQYIPGGGYHHVVRLGGLQPATKYDYSCGNSSAAGGASPVATFTSAKPSGTATSVLIFGDMGWESSAERGSPIPVGGLDANWSATLSRELMETLKNQGAFDLAWIVGDIAYADDSFGYLDNLLNFTYEEAYDGFMDWMSNVTSVIPYHVTVGNHESECHSPACIIDLDGLGKYLNNFTAYNARWAMPSVESNGVLNMWYSWDLGSVHYVSIDTSTDFPNAPEGTTGDGHFPELPAGHFAADGVYMAWLAADLKAAKANPSVKWIVAGGHRPFEDMDADNRAALTTLFSTYGVAMYFAGHGHSYSRYDPTAWGTGAVHIMVGGAGCDEMPYPPDQFNVSSDRVCDAWCLDPVVRAAFAQHGGPRPLTEIAAGAVSGDPCRYCGGSKVNPVGATPVYATAKMAIGMLHASDTELSWQLMLSPTGAVLDSVTIPHAMAHHAS